VAGADADERPVIGPERVQAVVDAYVDSYRRNDKEACIGLFAPDAEWHDPVGEPPHVGHEGVGAFWDQARALADSIELVPSDVIVCANQAAMVFQIHVTMGGPDTPTTMIMDAVEVFVLDDEGRIAELRAYWDMSRARTRA
jgi:steroid Delta-isomerase